MKHRSLQYQRDPHDAAMDAVSPDRLLDGEHSESMLPEDARHWITVYSEMLAFKTDVITTMERHLATMSPEAQAEAAGIDLTVTRTQAARYERRLRFWKTRYALVARLAGKP